MTSRVGSLGRLAFAAALLLGCGVVAAGPVKFFDDVKPLLAIHCLKCHGPETAKANLRLDLRSVATAPAKSGGRAVVPGDSGHSELYLRIVSADPEQRMPRKGPPLSAAQIELLRRWIDEGASWPDRDDYWAFQPPRSAAVPGVSSAPYPIDAFIGAELAGAKIVPVPRADSRTLLRRAYADLLGVPPSPAEAESFLNDRSPDAFDHLIDRLLDDPRYGQRWARHWLDVVRYSESDGFEDDKVRPHAWRYRDYVIRSLNSDKPFDRFVQEQIAGDELWPQDPDAWVATGFARLGMWDGMSKDPPRQRQDFLNDVTDAVGSVFLGMTVGCARCHDHKYDRITQRDYYALQAFFANVTRGTHELSGDTHDPPHVVRALREARSELARLRGERDGFLRDARDQLEWEHRCELDEAGQFHITDEQVTKRAQRLSGGRLAEIEKSIRESDRIEQLNEPVADATFETTANAPKTFVLLGGELSRRGPEVRPAFVQAMARDGAISIGLPADATSTGRRTALARWLTSPQNPLTARVMVNRLWQHHFGRGLVATPSDFGRNGRAPTHPKLLDWLACRFVADGWSLKRMHRLIMTSQAYQRASTFDSAAAKTDPDNTLLWRMNRTRLEAEAIRDSMLAVSGQLSPIAGGPGVYPRIPPDVNVELPNNDKELSWGTSTGEEDRRRSVYIFQRRSLTFPLVEVFDGAAMSQSCPVRAQTTVAPQALALLNGEFCREQARHLADRAAREAGENLDQRIRRLFRLALVREPSEQELSASKAFLTRQAGVHRASDLDGNSAAFVDLCHVLLNTNEFVYLD